MFIKNNKGVSLLEVLVTMGIITVLAGIAIPAYNSYKDGVKNTVVKADVSNARKAYLAYDAVNNTFCATLATAGLTGIGQSDLYEDSDKGFAGFKNQTAIGSATPCTLTVTELYKESGSAMGGASCSLNSSAFFFGAGFDKGGDQTGYYIGNNDSGPRKSKTTGSCSGSNAACSGTPAQANSGACTTAHATCSWTAGTIADICKDS